MAVHLNHTIVLAPDRFAEANWVAGMLGLPEPVAFGPFAVVNCENGVSLDFMDSPTAPEMHYAFLVSEGDYDTISGRLAASAVTTFADPGHQSEGYNTHDGGRACYFRSPAGHNLEILTRPYGSGGGAAGGGASLAQ